MIINLLLLLSICAATWCISLLFSRKFEEALPVTVFGITTLLFLFGCMGILKVGAYILLLCSAGSIVPVIVIAFRRKVAVKALLSPGMFFFVVLFAILCYLNFERLACNWDEFSHWLDCVKAMCSIDDFVANPQSHSLCKDYPPAMSLWQYYVERICTAVRGYDYFSEWRAYLAFQLYGLSALFPFFKGQKLRTAIVSGAIIVLAPLLFYTYFYHALYIDSIVGILAGAGFIYLLLRKECTWYDTAYLSLLCVNLSLCKDIGKYFAGMILLTYVLTYLVNYRHGKEAEKKVIIGIQIATPIGSTCIGVSLWKWIIQKYNAPILFSSEKLDPIAYLRMIFFHDDMTYRQTVVDSYWEAVLNNHPFQLLNTSVSITYAALLVIFAIILVSYLKYMKKRELYPSNIAMRHEKTVLSVVFLQAVLYLLFMGAIYAYNFSEYEATNLASFERYINMTFVPLWIVSIFAILEAVKDCSYGIFVLLLVIVLVTPIRDIYSIMTREAVRRSHEFRANYDYVDVLIDKYCDGDDHIFIVSQEDSGVDYWVCKYLARPNMVENQGAWSIGEPSYEGDVWTQNIDKDELRQLLRDGYDYLLVHNSNPYFINNYGSLFDGKIEDKKLYRVDQINGTLSPCE